ncbi:MAG: right-handed parallel beta-helix repeat-containing protein [Bacteroidales bacterium]
MKTLRITLTVCFMIVAVALSAKTVRYVKANASGDGTSWANASGSVQTMIDNSTDGDEVWVAKGTYYPTTETIARDARSRSFVVKNGVKFYGGFAGTETALSQRALADLDSNGKVDSFELLNQTILSGDIDGVADVWTKTVNSDSTWVWSVTGNSENCYNVVTGADKFLIDGFYVKGGNANTTTASKGGGIYITSASATSLITKCTVSECFSMSSGGGISSSAVVKNCLISKCHSVSGGGIDATYYTINCVVWNCTATNAGGGIYYGITTTWWDTMIFNCQVSNCSASSGGGVYMSHNSIAKCKISNCIGLNGGGICTGYESNIDSCLISDCFAVLNGGGINGTRPLKCVVKNCTSLGNGGGIYSNYGTDSCVISNCKTQGNGGGIYCPNVRDCKVTQCIADKVGGGIYSDSNYCTLTDCYVSDCKAGNDVGGIFASSFENYITNCVVLNCATGSAGNVGGIFAGSRSYIRRNFASVWNCIVKNCIGGGISESNGSNYPVSNCFVSNCSGFGINTSAVNCTVVNCSGVGISGAVNPTINCVVANCQGGGISYGHVSNCASSNNSLDGVIGAWVVGDATSNYISPDIVVAYVRPTSFIGAATTEAQKTELLLADWHLKKGSPCVNAGTDSNSSNVLNKGYDLDENARVVAGIVDIGAYEFDIPALVLPSSENFDQLTKWENSDLFLTSSLQTKWQITNQKALFDWHTNLTSVYSEAFVTYPMDATSLSSVFMRYDLYYEAYAGSISPLGTEKLNVEFSTDMTNWTSITTFSNANGTIANKTYKHDISNMAAGKKFYIRFNASGENSNRIEKWEVDNVIVDKDGTSGITPIIDRKMSFTITNGTLKINNLEANSAVDLYNMEGKLVLSTHPQTSTQSVSLPHRGVYLVKVKHGNQTETKKVVW